LILLLYLRSLCNFFVVDQAVIATQKLPQPQAVIATQKLPPPQAVTATRQPPPRPAVIDTQKLIDPAEPPVIATELSPPRTKRQVKDLTLMQPNDQPVSDEAKLLLERGPYNGKHPKLKYFSSEDDDAPPNGDNLKIPDKPAGMVIFYSNIYSCYAYC
jgi:hypothetical protein